MTRSLLALLLLLPAPSAVSADRPVGGPCDGCELALVGMPADPGHETALAPPGEPGTPMLLEGTVFRRDGTTPAKGVVVYFHQTADTGQYEPGANAAGATARHGRLRGWIRTGDDGRYVVRTIRPGAYPGRSAPAHIHVTVREDGLAPYWIDDVVFEDDPLVDAAYRANARGRGGPGIAAVETRDGVQHVRRDIVLGRNVTGY